ncbi:unnamed protein product [Menidia menidia]|uniref:(Atlantic silverside) hypothetical protein n=1 Tax=Menidia menidia TaxID=238744 RepID=A0A8S4BPC3_9TELE|nr:unnamed protein product [Menidia menidia]
MKTSCLKFLLLTGLFSGSLCAIFGEDIYVKEERTWHQARNYCRDHHTDLSLMINQDRSSKVVWTGLYNHTNGVWLWINGKTAAFVDLKPKDEADVCVKESNEKLQTTSCDEKLPFYCFESRLVLVKENKTWEEAMAHCRSTGKELVSLPSEAAVGEVLLSSMRAQTAQVWSGLRYLGDSWLWVDGTRLEYQPWGQGEIPECPAWTHHCGALSLAGHLESLDCSSQLNFICYETKSSG